MDILFTGVKGQYRTRLDDTSVEITGDAQGWSLHWIIHKTDIACTAEWWCEKLDCSLDDFEDGDVASDDYCHACPRLKTESSSQDSFTSGPWPDGRPGNLEDARRQLMTVYEAMAHNGLYKANPALCAIMYGTWSVKR